MKKILFLSHDAYRAGAPILFLNLADVLKEHRPDEFRVSFLIKNPHYQLIEEFNGYNVHRATEPRRDINGLFRWLTNKTGIYQHQTFNLRVILEALKGVDIVISNTITNGDILPIVRRYFKGPIISYIHELQIASKSFSSDGLVSQLISCTNLFAVPSNAVEHFLITRYSINKDRIKYMPYFIPSASSDLQKKTKSNFIVGGAGTIDWRKGPDIFIQVLAQVLKISPNASIQFVWQGAKDGIELDRLHYEADKLGVSKQLEFRAVSSSMDEFYNSLDILLLTSREDPYPLVVLEAAGHQVPTIAFDKAGGAVEFIQKSNSGRIVSYLDITSMGDAILMYYNDEHTRNQEGRNAQEYLNSTHRNPKFVVAHFNALIEEVSKASEKV